MRPVVDLVYPPRCPLCGDAIAEQGGLCASCWGELEFPGDDGNRDDPDGRASNSSKVTAATIYNDASRKLILMFKHGGKIALAKLLGRLMAAQIETPAGDTPLLVPVPLHHSRLWQRGFNQAALLARELEHHGKGMLLVDGLVRTKRTPSLGGLGRSAREEALTDAITVRTSRASTINGRDVILVDDVLTSGATSKACAKVLRKAGAKSVEVVCFAKVGSGHGS